MESSSLPNDEEVIELGDEITIFNDKYGTVRGRVYYRGEELISIMPDGVSDRVYEFPLEDGEFADELAVSEVKIHKKHIEDGFIRQHDLRVGQLMETFGKNGEKGATFTIRGVNEDGDMIEVTDSEGAVLEINFDYIGIPRDMPFVVIRNREAPAPVVEAEEGAEADEEADARSQIRTPLPEVGEIGDEAIAEDARAEHEDEEFELEVVGVITLPVQIEVEEIPAAERMYPESVQKADALNDFITRLTTLSQKDPRILRDIRILVEKMHQLKQDVMSNPRTSYDTLAELMRNVHVPIGRPVLDVEAKLYETEGAGEGVNQEEETKAAIEDKATGNFWINMLSYMNKYGQPWYSSERGEWSAMKDTEFFRGDIPDMETPAIKGYMSGLEMGQVGMSLGRALGPFYYSDSKKRQKIAFPGESAPLMNYILFPLKEAASFGTTRTGQLGIDMNNSMGQPRWTKQAIEAAGGIDEVATGNGFVVLGIKGNTLGNIPLADYFNALEIGGRGFEDFVAIMSQLGLMDKEVSKEVGDILGGKLDNTRKKLIEHIRTLREKLAAAQESFDVAAGQTDELIDGLTAAESDPILLDIMNKIRKGAPVIGKSGLVLLSALLKEEPDLFMAKAGGRADILARHQLTARRKQYMRTLTVTKRMNEYENTKGETPIPNSCKHVGLIRDIKRVDDLSTRFLHLINLVRNYQGERDMNWINCNICGQHLICIHEMLQMQQYLHPNEKEVLQKELVLNFSGPIVGGQYQCRNCGQGIAEIDYDRGMQFDDEGRPLNGRGEVIDEDALKKEEIEYIIKGPIGSGDKLVEGAFTPDNEEDEVIYLTIKEVCDRIGIFPDKAGYTNMMNATKTYMVRQRTREEYVAAQKARSKVAAGAAAAAVALDYDVYIKRILVGCIAAAILVEVQTKIPDYVVRYTLPGCMNPGFFGMPLGAETDKTGIQYVSCAVASIMKNESPWNMTGFQKEKNDVKRQQIVAKYVEAIIKDMSSDVTVQYNISAKKLYLKKTFGSEGVGDGSDFRQKDAIIPRFLPRMYILTKEDAADAPIIPEVIRDERQLADLWIRMGHRMARKTAFVVRGSPFSETTCCVSEVRRPAAFWDAISDLPKFEKRVVRAMTGGTRFMVPFSPRKLTDMLVAPKAEFYHRVFLNVCFRGPRMGLPHEPGLTLKCPWCDFKFPSHPRVLNYDGEGKSALAEQGVEITDETFRDVLDAAHKTTSVPPYVVGKVDDNIEILSELVAIMPAPSAAWNENVESLITGVKSLTNDATDVDIALAMATFSDVAATAEKVIRGRLGTQAHVIDMIHGLSGKNLHAVLYSYFLVPFQRLLTRLDPEAHLQIWNDYELSEKHVADIRNTIILPNESLQKKFLPVFKSPKASFANAKLRYYVKQLAAALARTDKLGSLTVIGRDDICRYIMHYILYVPLATLLNSNEIPPEEYDTSVTGTIIDSSIRLLMDIVAHTLGKYKDERLVYSDKELKERIQISNEKEAMHVLSIFDEMSDEMREIELMKKRYGIGRWAVGGTSLIYAYDPDRYDAEREERIMAGIVDMSEPGPEGIAPEGRMMDIYGFVMESGGEEDERIDLSGDYEDNF